MIKTKLFFFLTLCLSVQLNAQRSYWQGINSSDDLLSDTVNTVFVENDTAIWIGTQKGICFFNGRNVSIRFISGLTSREQSIRKFLKINQQLWVLTTHGLSKYENGSFVNYDETNGLLSNHINDIAKDQSGNLWIASDKGTSSFDGNQFTHHDSIVSKFIAVDSSNRVFIAELPYLIGNIYTIQVFHGGSWERVNTPSSILRSELTKLFLSEDNRLIAQCSEPHYYELNFPFNPIKHNLHFPTHEKNYNALFIEQNNTWVGLNSNGPSLLFGEDSNLVNFNVNIQKVNDITLSKNSIYVATDYGLFYSSKQAKPLNVNTDIDLQNFKTNINVNQSIFQNKLNESGLLIKDFGSAIYSSDFISVVKNGQAWINNPDIYGMWAHAGPKSNNSIGYEWPYIIQLSQTEIDDHKANFNNSGYQLPENIANWAANGDSTLGMLVDQAPYKDVNNNGCYDPENGDYPLIKGDQAVYWVRHSIKKNVPLAYHYMLYAFEDSTDIDLSKAIFLDCRIINRGNTRIDSIKTAYFKDWDLGNPQNDYIGCDSLNNTFFVYNGDSIENRLVNGNLVSEHNIPFVGARFLSDSMMSSIVFPTNNGQQGWVLLDYHYYLLATARWISGHKLTYGGDGLNNSSTIPTNYMFTGNPYTQSGWNSTSPGFGLSTIAPNDVKSFSSIPYYSLNPGESKTISVAIGFGRKDSVQSHLENFPEMQRVLKHAKAVWDSINIPPTDFSTNFNCTVIGIEEDVLEASSLKIYPNPTTNELNINSQTLLKTLEIYNLNGQLLIQNRLATNQALLSLGHYNHGIYLLRIETHEGIWENRKIVISE